MIRTIVITKVFCREESSNLSIQNQRCEFGVDCPGLLGERAGDRLHCELQPDRKYFRISQSHRLAGETGLCENVSCFVVTRAHISQSHEKLPYENNGLLELFARFTGWPVNRANNSSKLLFSSSAFREIGLCELVRITTKQETFSHKPVSPAGR